MDISMCTHSTCPARKRCERHAESGSRPNEYRQAYGAFHPDERGHCNDFIEKRRPAPAR